MTQEAQKKAGQAAFGCPYTNRRQLLLGLGGAGGALALGARRALAEEADGPQVTDAPTGMTSTTERVPFHGMHQAGIVTPRPANGIVAAFNVVAQTPADLEALFRKLTERIAFLTPAGRRR